MTACLSSSLGCDLLQGECFAYFISTFPGPSTGPVVLQLLYIFFKPAEVKVL